uniref:Integrase core domain containing protein n=1 Tax=Solanum tuberosum TaxID=4113 RepID=M1DAF8_SOLTU
MQRSIEDFKARMEHMMDAKIQAVHKWLDLFELRVLERRVPTINVTSFQMELARLCSDVDALISPTEVVLETEPEVEDDEVVMSTLFGDTMPPPDPSHAAG